MARENAADRFVASYSGWKAGSSSGPAAAGQTHNIDPVSLEEAILGGNHDRIIALVDAELDKAQTPSPWCRSGLSRNHRGWAALRPAGVFSAAAFTFR